MKPGEAGAPPPAGHGAPAPVGGRVDAAKAAPGRVDAGEAARAALDAAAGGHAVTVVLVVDGPVPAGSRLLVYDDGAVRGGTGRGDVDAALVAAARASAGGAASAARAASAAPARAVTVDVEGGHCRALIERHEAPEELVVVGAGHIGAALAGLGSRAGFRVTVLDDREDFVDAARLPSADRVVRMDFADPFREVALGARTWVLLATRAHRYDYDCLRRLLEASPAPRWIGMIGSRRRVRAAFSALLREGVARERVATVSAPVGLDLGAETPDEIALSIAAEIVLLRRGGTGARLAEKENVLDRLLPREGAAGLEAPEVGKGDEN